MNPHIIIILISLKNYVVKKRVIESAKIPSGFFTKYLIKNLIINFKAYLI